MTNPTQLIEQLVGALEKARSFEEGGTGLAMAALSAARAYLEQPAEPAPIGINGLTYDETSETMSVRGLSEPAPSTAGGRAVCGICGYVGTDKDSLGQCPRCHWDELKPSGEHSLRSALNAMLTQFGMDEDEWNKPTFDQARTALLQSTALTAAQSELVERLRSFESDHKPDGWPAIQMRDISALLDMLQSTALPVGELTDEQIRDVCMSDPVLIIAFTHQQTAPAGSTETGVEIAIDRAAMLLARSVLAAARPQPVLEPLTERQLYDGQWADGSGSSADFREGARFAESHHGITQGGKV
jgi:hypothetical protein